MKTSSYEFDILLSKLTKAIQAKDKKKIILLYDQFNEFDLEKVNARLLKQYDKLIDKANSIVLT